MLRTLSCPSECNGLRIRNYLICRTLIILNELLLHLIDTLSLPLEERAARRALRDFCEGAGFDFFAYLHLRGQESFAVSNYPQPWCDRYVQRNYLLVDPVVTKAKHGPPIFTWSADEAKRAGRRDVTQFYKDASRFGIRSGLSISAPLGFKDRMVFTLSSNKPPVCIDEDPDPVTAAMAVAFVHSRLGGATRDATLPAKFICRRAKRNASDGSPMGCRCRTSPKPSASATGPSDHISTRRPVSSVRRTADRPLRSPFVWD